MFLEKQTRQEDDGSSSGGGRRDGRTEDTCGNLKVHSNPSRQASAPLTGSPVEEQRESMLAKLPLALNAFNEYH